MIVVAGMALVTLPDDTATGTCSPFGMSLSDYQGLGARSVEPTPWVKSRKQEVYQAGVTSPETRHIVDINPAERGETKGLSRRS